MKRHPFDAFSFLAGLFFVTVALVALAGGISLDVSFDLAWVLPVLLIGAGIALLASIASTRRRSEAAREDLRAAGVPTGDVETEEPATDPWLADDDLAATVEEVDAAREANTAVHTEDEGRS